ncbi:MAG: pancreas/duodenum homeobox protein 1 [Desulfofustis sp.]|jgi:hypothetical protein
MTSNSLKDIFTAEACAELLPADTADRLFDALFGDASEGSYDLEIQYRTNNNETLLFDILLHERPGHCLACNLTYGLPEVFSRHPVININGIVEKINDKLGDRGQTGVWKLGATTQQSQTLHAIPLVIELR